MSVERVDSVGGRELHTVIVIKDEKGYGMTVSGNDPVQVQSVVKGGAAWRAGVRKGDRLLVVNGTAVATEGHAHVVELIKASPTVVLKLQRFSTITAPLPVCREKQLQVDHTKIKTIELMLENEVRYMESLRNSLAKNQSERKQTELEAAEVRRSKLQQQLYMHTSPTSVRPNDIVISGVSPHHTETPQQRQGFLSNLPRSLSSLTGQSIRGIKANSNNNNNNNHAQAPPVTCLDGSAGPATLPPPLPPRSSGPPIPPPPPPPLSSSVNIANHHNPHQHRHHHTAPNSIGMQMSYPLVTGTPPLIQNAGPGHHRSKSSPEELNEINNANDEKEWELVNTPPGTPPPPYPVSPAPPITLDTQRAIISMEEDDVSPTLPRNSFSSGGFTCVDTLSIARLAVFLNWVAGERRPAQSILFYLLSEAYSKGPSTVLARWAYELHSAFLVPGAPLALSNVDENMAREIDDALIRDHDKEDILRKIFFKVREKAKEEMTQQLHEFQVKRQLGLGSFYGPSDSILNQCDSDKAQELDVIMKYLLPSLNVWIDNSSMDAWGATQGSPSYALLAASVPALLQHTFCLKPQLVNNVIGGSPGSPPRPAFLQRDKLFKQRLKHLNKSPNHPLTIRGHHLSPITVTSVCHCHHCHLLVWGVAPQAYNCSDCKLRVHRSCARQVEEPCCGPTAVPTRMSRLMEKLAPAPAPQITTGISHQHLDSNQHHHHHPHEKRQKKSSAASHFLNMDRSSRKEEELASAMDTSTTSHNTSDKVVDDKEITGSPIPDIVIHDTQDGESEKDDTFEQIDIQSLAHVLTDSECIPNIKKKSKLKHRKTMSMSGTIELVKCLGEDWIEAAKREIDEHSKKREQAKKKEKNILQNKINDKITCDKNIKKADSLDNHEAVTLVLYDATIGETDDFEIIDEHDVKKLCKKKELKEKESGKNRKLSAVSMMSAQKNTVKMLAKASSVTALNFIRNKRKHLSQLEPMDGSPVDHSILYSELLLEHERAHTNLVQDPSLVRPFRKCDKKEIDKDAKLIKKFKKETEKAAKQSAAKDKHNSNTVKKDSTDSKHTEAEKLTRVSSIKEKVVANESKNETEEKCIKTSSGEEDDTEVYYDANSGNEDLCDEGIALVVEQTRVFKPVKPKRSSGASLKRVGGGRRRVRKRSNAEEAPPLPPRQHSTASSNQRHSNSHQKHPHWLFGSSTKGDSRRDDDTGTESASQLTDSSHFSSEHSAERADSTNQPRSGIAVRPVTRAESYRDRVDRVKRTKRKTSDPNQLSSNPNRDYHDVEVLGAVGGPAVPSGGSSNSSLSSKSNDSTHPDQDSASEWSDEEDCSAPWSSRAPPELLASMSNLARKRQDLIHELICSEWSHVRWLRVIRRVYLIPLQRAGSTLLSPQELRALLPNLPDVLQRHRTLAKDLRALQQAPKAYTGSIADALISMLGESKYSAALSRFCGGQGLALDALRERKKRNKELSAFLTRCEQDPLCARLRLQDLLACVWQRLTKYQLLLEAIRNSAGAIEEEMDPSDPSQCEDFTKVSHALELAKDVLNKVNTAIKTTENEHRLRSIQNKLDIRLNEMPDGGGDLKKLDLARHSLAMEGTLNIRQDSSKKVNVLALLMRECLVLLHTDGDKYILKPIPQTTHAPLSPVIYWDKVIYRNNAAVKNGFFLVNFDGVLYEFSALSNVEYNTWAKHLMEYGRGLGGPKIVLTDEGPAAVLPMTPPTSLPSPDTVPNGTPEPEPVITETKVEPKPVPENADDGNKVNGTISLVTEDEAGITGHQQKMDHSLIDPAVLSIQEPPATEVAVVEITPEEKLRRAEKTISSALTDASEAFNELSGKRALLRNALTSIASQDEDKAVTDSTQNLLIQAQEHVNKLTEVLLRALRVPIIECSSTKCRLSFSDGLCDTCSAKCSKFLGSGKKLARNPSVDSQRSKKGEKTEVEENLNSIVLEEIGESSTDPTADSDVEMVEGSGAGLRSILSELVIRLSNEEAEKNVLRARLQKADERIHSLHHQHKDCKHSTEEPAKPGTVEEKPSSSNDTSSGPG